MAHIFIVDDEPAMLSLVEHILTHEGHHCSTFTRVSEMLDALAVRIPDLIITDIVMPDEDGLGLIVEIRHRGLQTPIIAMSGSLIGQKFLTAAEALGATAHIGKPFRSAALAELVAKVLISGTAA